MRLTPLQVDEDGKGTTADKKQAIEITPAGEEEDGSVSGLRSATRRRLGGTHIE